MKKAWLCFLRTALVIGIFGAAAGGIIAAFDIFEILSGQEIYYGDTF